ncbi:MAG: hypothetical protein CNC89_04710 [Puniceicoccaceae bacterium MED-G31]|nr:MAG: hypothetical protein CNC89_04710 [Puniceicoccaceae bacterium MED-G31]
MINYIFSFILFVLFLLRSVAFSFSYNEPTPFGDNTDYALESDNAAVGRWWDAKLDRGMTGYDRRAAEWFQSIDRNNVLAFALYTHDHKVLKLSAQCFPLLPDEPKVISLELKINNQWVAVQSQPVVYPGWSAHFRIEDWDSSKNVAYRLSLGELSSFGGLIRRDPRDKDSILIASLNCNSPVDKEFDTRHLTVQNLRHHDPDLLFFAGDQNYTHDEATYGWLQFGVQFAAVMKDRPTICILDDHDVGHPNIWGESGKVSIGTKGAADGGYMFPADFVGMVERQQTWHLPDPFDPTPIKQGIGVYYTDLNVGGLSIAILEDRKFKSAPIGNIPQMGPRPDHITDPKYDRSAIDLPGLRLLGKRQLNFLDAWARDWIDVKMKVALSQTAFCGAVHIHGNEDASRLLADLDCNGWPQTARNEALRALRRAHASHLCGDQHLAVTVQHGIDNYRDGPYAFTAPAIVNTIYGRWWHPKDERQGGGQPIVSPHPWVGDYIDGLGNKITMHAYANPINRKVREQRGDGYGLIRFHKPSGQTTFECWPRFVDVSIGDASQYTGWPIIFNASDNDGRKPVGYLKEVYLPKEDSVVELTNDVTGELIYCYRIRGNSFSAPVYSYDEHTLKYGENIANFTILSGASIQ